MTSEGKKVALISGGNRGIGFAIAQQLAQQGIHVVIGSRDLDSGLSAVTALTDGGLSSSCVQLDVNDANSRVEAVKNVLETEGRLDILVNNAGVALDKWVPTEALELDVLRDTMETNLYAPLHLSQLVLPAMKQQGHGRIVNMSSELGSLTNCEMGSSAAYRISKTALNMLTRLLSLELKEHPDILVNAAAPGWVKTELGGEDAPLTPEQGADTAVWLATLPDDGPNGGFFKERKAYAW